MISVFQTYVVVVVNLEDWALPKIFLFEAPILTISKELSTKKMSSWRFNSLSVCRTYT